MPIVIAMLYAIGVQVLIGVDVVKAKNQFLAQVDDWNIGLFPIGSEYDRFDVWRWGDHGRVLGPNLTEEEDGKKQSKKDRRFSLFSFVFFGWAQDRTRLI